MQRHLISLRSLDWRLKWGVIAESTGGNKTGSEMAELFVRHLKKIERFARKHRPPFVALVSDEGVSLSEGFGRAWTGENGGDYQVVDVNDFGMVVTLGSMKECPAGAALYVTSTGPFGSGAGLPLFFFVRV